MKVQQLIALILTFLSVTCAADEPNMNDSKTYCVGRYLVDVPANMELYAQMGEYMFGLVQTNARYPNSAAFLKRMREREESLKKPESKNDLAFDRAIDLRDDGMIFLKSVVLYRRNILGVEAYKWINGRTFFIDEDGFAADKYEKVTENLKTRFLPSLRARIPDQIPAEAGFCIKDGYFADDGKTPQHEIASITFELPSAPGLLVHVTTMTAKPDAKSLLQRVDGGVIPSALQALVSGIRTLKRGEHDVNGRKGEEGLWSLPTDAGFRSYQFQWEAQGEHLQPLKPTLSVELTTRADQRSGLSDEQATKLFESIVNSVRLRPVSGGAQASDAGTPPVPLHSIVRTGAACPRSGWWTCPEANGLSVVGGSRQYFELGTVMPPVEVLSQPSILDRVLGRVSKHSVPTTWTLVAADDVAPPDTAGTDNDSPKV
ncbi:T6SS immunity protein Tli4 family protein [Burkholderia sp. IMCC1007]|uniref:T6SS immunity protein Tli4 family protein n=1 Tax=Burkholderia sp. IMCC1007 TaxID=3004104 RepID=UPI0022B32816|nr:T6SS immunity protein Tli4 family protein [Burkholderia sp. IMCC1007]